MIDIGFGMVKVDLGTLVLIVSLVTIVLDVLLILLSQSSKKWEIYSNACFFIGITAIISSFLYFSYSVLTADYSFTYVISYANNNMDFLQRLSAIWSGQAGSYFFWAFLATLFYLVFRNLFQKFARETFFRRSFVLFAVQVAFLIALTILSEPFEITEQAVTDGFGLDPILLNLWNIIHPPVILAGYALCLVPMVIGMVKISILKDGKVPDFEGKKQLDCLLEFTVSLAWLFLSSGIIIGSYWAYTTLGWGGFWAWDPVETASLVPWLFLTLYYHGRPLHSKNAYLANYTLSITYVGALFATYLTRSGIISSVHTFQPRGTLESLLKPFVPENSFIMSIILRVIPDVRLLLLFIILVVSFAVIHLPGIKNKEIFRFSIPFSRKDFQASRSHTTALKVSYVSIFLGTCITIIGLIAPVIYDIIGYIVTFKSMGFGSSITIGALFYNTVLTCFGGITLLAQFFCVFYPRLNVKTKAGLAVGGLFAGLIFAVSGLFYRDGSLYSIFGETNPLLIIFGNFWTSSDKANLLIPLLLLGMVGLVAEFVTLTLREDRDLVRKASRIMLHFSFLVILLGAVTSANMTISNELTVQSDNEYPIPGTSLTITVVDLEKKFPDSGLYAVEYDTNFILSAGERIIGSGVSRLSYDKINRNNHKVMIFSDLFADIYIVTAGIFEDSSSGAFVVTTLQVKIIPYIGLLWTGCLILHTAIVSLVIGKLILAKQAFSTSKKVSESGLSN